MQGDPYGNSLEGRLKMYLYEECVVVGVDGGTTGSNLALRVNVTDGTQ